MRRVAIDAVIGTVGIGVAVIVYGIMAERKLRDELARLQAEYGGRAA